MAVATHLADKSALARFHVPEVDARLAPMLERGLLGTCGIIELEVRYSARSLAAYQDMRINRPIAFEWIPMPDEVWDHALDVQAELADRGQLRAVTFPDLLIAATAERHDLAVIHYDADYDLISAITGQATEWVVPQGSVP